MAIMIKSPGFGPAYWKNPDSLPATLPMTLVWDNVSEFEIGEYDNFNVSMNIGATSNGIKTRGWNYTITLENNTDPTNVTITSGTGTFNSSGSSTFTTSFPTSAFLTTGTISQPSLVELTSKFGPIRGGDNDTRKYNTLLRDVSVQPTPYKNIIVEEVSEGGVPYPSRLGIFTSRANVFALVFKIVRTNTEGLPFTITDYRVLGITFTSLIDIE
jgi:hypothetical protein